MADTLEELRREIAAAYAERREVAAYAEIKRQEAAACASAAEGAAEAAGRLAREAVEMRVTERLRAHAEAGVLPPSEQDLAELNALRLEHERRTVRDCRSPKNTCLALSRQRGARAVPPLSLSDCRC
jgi:chorismate mutase